MLSIEIQDPDHPVNRMRARVLERMLVSYARSGQVEKATELLDGLQKKNEANWLLVQMRAEVYREAGKFEDSAATYLDFLDRVKKDDKLKESERDALTKDARYVLSGVYVDLKQIDKAADQLKALLKTRAGQRRRTTTTSASSGPTTT